MFVRDSVVVRVSGAALASSLEESSKPAASVFGGPFPHTPVAKTVVAGVGCLFVVMSAGLFTQLLDMTEAQASPALRITAPRVVELPLAAAPAGAIDAARPLARH
jgi:hypothetical protein